MKKIFLHIGLHKTGSTTIQAFLQENKHAFLEHGYFFPKTGSLVNSFGSHHNLAWLLMNSTKADPALGTWEELQVEIEKANSHDDFDCIIVSSEEFEFLNQNDINNLKLKLESYEVKIIAYVRRQDQLLESHYGHHIRGALHSGNILSLAEKIKKRLDYYWVLEPWKKAFGVENLIVRPLEKKQISSICHDFLTILEIDNLSLFREVDYKNIRPGRKTLEVLKLVNKIYENRPKKRKKYLDKINNLTSKYWSEKMKYRLLSYSDSYKIIQEYEQSNVKVAQEYLGRPDGVLFYEQLEPYEKDDFTIEDLSKEELLSLILAVVE